MKRLIPFSLILLCFATAAHAATINAAGCTQADVQTAISAATTGDTVNVPAGSCTWSNLNLNKAITLKGATTCTGAGATLSCTAGTSITGGPAITITAGARVTGFTLLGGGSGSGVVETTYAAAGWRIDHSRVNVGASKRGIFTYGIGAGLIDHVYFDTANGAIDVDGEHGDNGTYSWCESHGATCNGTYSWAQPMSLINDTQRVFIEDNRFEFTSITDGAFDFYGGSRVTVRYNYINNVNSGSHGLDSGGERSSLSTEIYGNTFAHSGSDTIYVTWNSRGGTNMIFNNTVTGLWGDLFWLQNYRSSTSFGDWGTCTGSNAIDRNDSGQQGYPCRDQPGRGPESAPANDWPQKSSAWTYSEVLMPVYSWNNMFKGSLATYSNISVGDSNGGAGAGTRVYDYHVKANRDYYNEVSPFTGATGVGVGTLASRPATCTTSAEAGGGVAYWATDESKLYRCSATNTWTLHYTPYTYPHPLQGGGSVPVGSPPATPSSLGVR